MTKDVLLTIKGLQLFEGTGSDEIETIYPGEYFYRNQSHFILYDEQPEGIPEVIKNMVKLNDREFVITKKGPVTVQMVFEEGKKTMTDYNTPFGNIMISMDTSKLEVEESEDRLKIHIEYALEANYQFVADCKIDMEIASK